MAAKKKESPATLKVSGKVHRVYKDKKGDVVVDHAGSKKENGKYDKIDLTKKAGPRQSRLGLKPLKTGIKTILIRKRASNVRNLWL